MEVRLTRMRLSNKYGIACSTKCRMLEVRENEMHCANCLVVHCAMAHFRGNAGAGISGIRL